MYGKMIIVLVLNLICCLCGFVISEKDELVRKILVYGVGCRRRIFNFGEE